MSIRAIPLSSIQARPTMIPAEIMMLVGRIARGELRIAWYPPPPVAA